MMTRSKTRQYHSHKVVKKNQMEVNDSFPTDIDFDEASMAWRNNKRYLGNGMFAYKHNKRTHTLQSSSYTLRRRNKSSSSFSQKLFI